MKNLGSASFSAYLELRMELRETRGTFGAKTRESEHAFVRASQRRGGLRARGGATRQKRVGHSAVSGLLPEASDRRCLRQKGVWAVYAHLHLLRLVPINRARFPRTAFVLEWALTGIVGRKTCNLRYS